MGIALIGHTFNPMTARINDLWDGTMLTLGLTGADYAVIAVSVAVMLAVEWFEETHEPISHALAKKNGFIQWTAMVLPILAIIFFGIYRDSYISSAFIYGQY